ncbi:carboxypeptidase-like regulatory domain-containing protein [Crocinitomix catalasitica]|uniref:carboxypeptidase-like regulatory domain-containing protein n=1 Tax=Crocinitomix catalasitica TaxID=184607 RepID=UPI000483ED7F|nr:carboxypeptidase-like regulatory domain-containing protein [Crocinitomix catalasitica]
MKKSILIIAVLLFTAISSSAQVGLGTIKGTVYEAENPTIVIPYTKVWVETESGTRRVKADINGKYSIEALRPGTYNVISKGYGFDTMQIASVKVSADGFTTVNIMSTNHNVMTTVTVVYNSVKIEHDIVKIKFLTEDIENSVFLRSPVDLLVGSSSDITMIEGTNDIIIRGSRPGDAIYYIDGVKMDDMGSIPGIAISGLEAYTGGIPAKYGDTTGGVISLETKGYFDLYYAWKARQ